MVLFELLFEIFVSGLYWLVIHFIFKVFVEFSSFIEVFSVNFIGGKLVKDGFNSGLFNGIGSYVELLFGLLEFSENLSDGIFSFNFVSGEGREVFNDGEFAECLSQKLVHLFGFDF